MIIFDLDGTLADCEHRRHFVKEPPIWERNEGEFDPMAFNVNADRWRNWKPNWQAFYEACDLDKPIEPTIDILSDLIICDRDVVIWSGRCESVREETIEWLQEHIYDFWLCPEDGISIPVLMRPLGDTTPDDQLKESWLDEAIKQGIEVEYVFDDRPKVIRMWRRRGIFVFNCAQHDGKF